MHKQAVMKKLPKPALVLVPPFFVSFLAFDFCCVGFVMVCFGVSNVIFKKIKFLNFKLIFKNKIKLSRQCDFFLLLKIYLKACKMDKTKSHLKGKYYYNYNCQDLFIYFY